MPKMTSEDYVSMMTADLDRKNLDTIRRACATGRINDVAATYLTTLYSDSMKWDREMFYFLGKCFGAPKAAVMRYDYATDSAIDEPIKISDITPLVPYIVQHRLDADPMRNQFFDSHAGHRIDLAVSSIVTVIVGAQKSVERALDKITGKYYKKYVTEVTDTVYRIISGYESAALATTITDQVREKLSEKYNSSASELVLQIIGSGHEKIAVELVRALDRIKRPRMRLQDVWRAKCLFDLVPQARTFIERVRDMMPERILSIRDSFYDIDNPRNYRDAKFIINIGTDGVVVPMEIICQVRTFFDFERRTHDTYEVARRIDDKENINVEQAVALMHEDGVKEYNLLVVRCLEDLFERVGWNILYSHGLNTPLFDGFPKDCTMHYPQKMVDTIMDKLDNATENEVFHVTSAPAKLTVAQETEIFRWLARFILVTAMPYADKDWSVPTDTMAGKLFNFVMKEVQRYYNKD